MFFRNLRYLECDGWQVTGGKEATRVPVGTLVQLAVHERILYVDTPIGIFQFRADKVWDDYSHNSFAGLCAIKVMAQYSDKLVRQQASKAEGGGWREVPAWQVALTLENPSLREKMEKDAKSRMEVEQQIAERRQQAEAENQERRRQDFISGLFMKFGGKKLTGIDACKEGLSLTFEDGTVMNIDITVGGYEFDGWMEVDGISIDTFEKASRW